MSMGRKRIIFLVVKRRGQQKRKKKKKKKKTSFYPYEFASLLQFLKVKKIFN
jgi:hypothetical protein